MSIICWVCLIKQKTRRESSSHTRRLLENWERLLELRWKLSRPQIESRVRCWFECTDIWLWIRQRWLEFPWQTLRRISWSSLEFEQLFQATWIFDVVSSFKGHLRHKYPLALHRLEVFNVLLALWRLDALLYQLQSLG